jgi:transcriptional regulator with XRE-family HTH domain
MQLDSAQKLGDLRKLRRKSGVSQQSLAKQLGISQSTVSRRERIPSRRHSDATMRLCKYADTNASSLRNVDRRAIHKAINEVLRKSDAHAVALSEIVEAFVDLCRADGRDRDKEDLG